MTNNESAEDLLEEQQKLLERCQQALYHSEVRFRRMAELLPEFLFEADANGVLTYASQRWLDYSGLTAECAADKERVIRTFHPDDEAALRAVWARSRAPAKPYGVEARIRRYDGVYGVFVIKAEPVIEHGAAVRWFGTATDISDMRSAEVKIRQLTEDLRHRLAVYETLVEAVPVGVYISLEPDCSSITTNPAGAALLRSAPDADVSLTGPHGAELPYRVFQNGAEVAGENLPMQRAARLGRPVIREELDIVFKDGSVTTLYEHASPLFDEQGKVSGCVGVGVDITERKRSERALRESEHRFQLIARSTNDAIWDWDLVTNKVWWNEGVRTLFGYSPEEAAADSFWWDRHVHPEDVGRVIGPLFAAIDGDETSSESEYRFRCADGSTAFVLDRFHILRNEQGKAVRIVGSMQDLTDRKRAEDALKEAGRRKDEFLATLAHELRNPLGALSSAAQLLAKASDDPAVAGKAREIVHRQVDHMARLLDDLLDVSRITHGFLPLRMERLNVVDAIHAAVETVWPQIEAKGHRLELHAPSEALHVDADHIRLGQVIGNLLSNAAKYTDAGGVLEVSARQEGDQVVIVVADNGIGMSVDMLAHVFEMFWQASPALQRSEGGLGIGLSLVHGLVQLHGGVVEAASDGPGRGSRFTVRLPHALAQREPSRVPRKHDPGAGRVGVRILVADDNVDSATSWGMLLELAGHEVRIAHNGLRAVEIAQEFKPHLALLDIGMPELNGYEVAQRMRAANWGANATLVALTGWGHERDRQQAREAGFDHHFTKPVEMSALEPILASLTTH